MAASLWVKICGVTDEADAVQAAELGVDAIGLNFYKESPRQVTVDKAELIIRALPRHVDIVGIFVSDYSPDAMSSISVTRQIPLHIIQVHGPDQDLGFHMIRAHHILRTHSRWIPAFSVSEKDDLLKISRFVKQCERKGMEMPGERPSDLVVWMNIPQQKSPYFPAAILVDARVPGQLGGTGKTVPWDLLADFHPEVPLILAGGLTAENVAEAVRIVRPYGVDVASGVEKSPGRKDADKMKRFIENAREAAERLH
jgi:phosphoribosylanthranilate isomerase